MVILCLYVVVGVLTKLIILCILLHFRIKPDDSGFLSSNPDGDSCRGDRSFFLQTDTIFDFGCQDWAKTVGYSICRVATAPYIMSGKITLKKD